jgi:hypothetical protein
MCLAPAFSESLLKMVAAGDRSRTVTTRNHFNFNWLCFRKLLLSCYLWTVLSDLTTTTTTTSKITDSTADATITTTVTNVVTDVTTSPGL